jgi:hypothetical protein
MTSHEADDKLIGVLVGDGAWGEVTDVTQTPASTLHPPFIAFRPPNAFANPSGVGGRWASAGGEGCVCADVRLG